MKAIKYKDRYLVQFEEKVYRVNGEIVNGKDIPENNGNPFYWTKSLSFSELPSVELECSYSQTTHYEDEQGNKLSLEGYQKTEEKFNEIKNGEYEFNNLDDEYEYKKFKKRWINVDKEVIEYKRQTITVLYVPQVNTPYTKPDFSLEKESIEKNTVTYAPNVAQLIHDIAKKYGFEFMGDANHSKTEGLKYAFSENSGVSHMLRYTRINGSYYNMSDSVKTYYRGTVEEVGKVHEKNVEYLDNMFGKISRVLKNKTFNRESVIGRLEVIRRVQGEVMSMKKTARKNNQARSLMDKLIQDLKDLNERNNL